MSTLCNKPFLEQKIFNIHNYIIRSIYSPFTSLHQPFTNHSLIPWMDLPKNPPQKPSAQHQWTKLRPENGQTTLNLVACRWSQRRWLVIHWMTGGYHDSTETSKWEPTCWLTPLKNLKNDGVSSSVGMMKFPLTYGKIISPCSSHHQPV